MRVVLDTNVVASALLWGGTPERLIEAAGEGTLELFTSEALLAELAGILGRAKFSVLACALAARVDAIVTGDADLHAFGNYQGISVLSPAQTLQRIAVGS